MLPTTLNLTHMLMTTLLTQNSNGYYNSYFSLHQRNIKEHQNRSSAFLSVHIIEQWGRAMNIKTFWYSSLCYIALKRSNETKKIHAHRSNEFHCSEFFWAMRIILLVAKSLIKFYLLYVIAAHIKVIQLIANIVYIGCLKSAIPKTVQAPPVRKPPFYIGFSRTLPEKLHFSVNPPK